MPKPDAGGTVAVDPKIGVAGDEEFYTGADLFSKEDLKAQTDAVEGAKKGKINAQLLVFPIKQVHALIADRTGYDGFRVQPEEEAYWTYLAEFAIDNLPTKYLIPIVMLGGLAVLEARKVAGLLEFLREQKEHPRNPGASGGSG
jgi:hypothetical protein